MGSRPKCLRQQFPKPPRPTCASGSTLTGDVERGIPADRKNHANNFVQHYTLIMWVGFFNKPQISSGLAAFNQPSEGCRNSLFSSPMKIQFLCWNQTHELGYNNLTCYPWRSRARCLYPSSCKVSILTLRMNC